MSGSYGCSVRGVSIHSSNRLPNVYADYASKHVPRTFSDVIDWSEHVMTLTDELGDGLRKLYSYFLTPLQPFSVDSEITSADIQHELRMMILLQQTLDYFGHAFQMGVNLATYGNDFITMSLNHTRVIQCKSCGRSVVVKDVDNYKGMDLKFNGEHFIAKCQNRGCGVFNRPTVMNYMDKVEKSASSIVFKHWPIRELEFDYREMRDELQIYWRVPERVKKLIDKNDPMTLHDYDISILKAAKTNKLFLFDDSVMFHARHPTLSGLLLQGLGLPRTLCHARPHWLIQLLNKQCQVLAGSYLNPIPFFSHDGSAPVAGDPIHGADHQQIGAIVDDMVNTHRMNPEKMFYVPYNVRFQYAAGHAEQFVPTQLLQFATDKLTNGLLPMSLLKGQINHQTAPFFLRMFESLNREIPHLYNRFLWWVLARISSLCGMESVNLIHIPSSVVDNPVIDSMLFNASMSGKASNTSWMSRIHMNPRHENNRILTETKEQMDIQKKIEDYQSQIGIVGQVNILAGQGIMETLQGQPDGAADGAEGEAMGMMPGQLLLPSQGYSPPMDISQMESDSVAIASMLAQMPQQDRNRELAALKAVSEPMHSMVTSELRKLRQQMGLQGRQQLAPNL